MPPSLARDPSCLASLPSNSKLLAPLSQHRSSQVAMCSPGWQLKSFRMSRSSPRDRDPVMISVSISRDDPGSSSSLPQRSALFASFFSFTGAAATGTGWSLGSATMPAAGAGAGAAAVPAGETEADPAAVAATMPVGGGCDCLLGWRGCRAGWGLSASHSGCHFVSPPFPFKALNSIEQGSVGVGQTPAYCSDLCLSGVPRVAAHFLQILY